jgi:hypothetical protein
MAESQSFLAKLFSSIFKSDDPEAEKKRRIKLIAKNLSKAKYHFYKNDEVLPAFAKLLYDIYKAVFPAKAMFMAQENPNRLKSLAVNYSLNEKEHQIIDSLTEEGIKEAAQHTPIEQLEPQVRQNIDYFLQVFNGEKIARIEALYRKLMIFKSFCSFDFYFTLKKFDSSLKEGEFTTVPHFEKINAEYISEDLKDFLAVAWLLPEREDWSDMMKFFKESKGTEPVTLNVWNKICNKINSIRLSRVFEMMIQVITKDPNYIPDFSYSEEPIVDNFIDKTRNDAEKTLNSLVLAQQNNKIDGILEQIFGTTSIERLTNYTATNSALYERKGLGTFDYVQPLNYFKAFLLDFVKKDVREFSDLVLVRGTWSTQALSAPMSNAYHALLETSDTILAFDAKIAEDAEIGSRIKTHMPRAERDKEAKNIIGTLIGDLNDEAKAMLVDGTKNLITIAKTTKTLLEDYAKPKGEVIINWKELDKFADHPVKELGVGVYKHIYLFVQLMQNCLK